MIGSLIITTREGLEASLIIGIILAYLARTGHHGYTRAVWAGAATAIAISVTIGAAIFVTVGELTETSEQVVEGAAMLLAAAVLSYTVIWMRHQASGLSATLQSQVSNAVGTGSGLALFILALVAVLREGVETALFLFAAASASSVDGHVIHPGLGQTIHPPWRAACRYPTLSIPRCEGLYGRPVLALAGSYDPPVPDGASS